MYYFADKITNWYSYPQKIIVFIPNRQKRLEVSARQYVEKNTRYCIVVYKRQVIFSWLPTNTSLRVVNFGQVRSVGSKSKQTPRCLALFSIPTLCIGHFSIIHLFQQYSHRIGVRLRHGIPGS